MTTLDEKKGSLLARGSRLSAGCGCCDIVVPDPCVEVPGLTVPFWTNQSGTLSVDLTPDSSVPANIQPRFDTVWATHQGRVNWGENPTFRFRMEFKPIDVTANNNIFIRCWAYVDAYYIIPSLAPVAMVYGQETFNQGGSRYFAARFTEKFSPNPTATTTNYTPNVFNFQVRAFNANPSSSTNGAIDLERMWYEFPGNPPATTRSETIYTLNGPFSYNCNWYIITRARLAAQANFGLGPPNDGRIRADLDYSFEVVY